MIRDLRNAARTLATRPALTAVAALSLGLGVGANVTIFSAVNAVMFASVPVADPANLIGLYTIDWENPEQLTGVGWVNFEDFRDECASFSALAAQLSTSLNLVPARGEARQVSAQLVTANWFDVLGVQPILGRAFTPDEDVAPSRVAILSHALWDNEFGADPDILGTQINLSGQPFTVVGVGPAGFKGLQVLGSAERVWLPMQTRELVLTGFLGRFHDTRRARFNQVVGRLAEGVTLEQARQEVRALGEYLARTFPDENEGRSNDAAVFSPLSSNQRAEYGRVGALMMSIVGVVLLIACANVANLLLARAAERAKEIAIRVALGAGRGYLVRMLLTESLLLAALGGAVGVLIAFWARDLLWAFRPPGLAADAVRLGLDPGVLAFAVAVSLGTGLLFGLAPALQASRPDLRSTLQEGGRRSTGGSSSAVLRNGLVVAEVALAMVALIGAGLFVRSLANAQAIDPGFESEKLALLRLDVGNAGYQPAEAAEFWRGLEQRLATLPGAVAVGLQSGRLLGGGLPHTTYPQGGIDLPQGLGVHVHEVIVTPAFFETVGISLLAGRQLSELDDEGAAPVAVVNEATLRRLWPGVKDPLGLRFTRSLDPRVYEIVGVVEDVLIDLGSPPQPVIYTPLRQNPQDSMQVQLRTAGAPEGVLLDVQRVIRELDPNLPVQQLGTIRTELSDALWAPRTGVALLSAFGLLALALAVVGIYGVTTYNVTQRHHELGVRVALGATAGAVVRLILRQGMSLVAGGIVAGAGLGFVLARSMSSMLWGVGAIDPVTYLAVAALLALVALVANLVPALRVSGIDPISAMRDEY